LTVVPTVLITIASSRGGLLAAVMIQSNVQMNGLSILAAMIGSNVQMNGLNVKFQLLQHPHQRPRQQLL
jgi:hypothetical protein